MDLGNDHKTYLPTLLIAFLLSVSGVFAIAPTPGRVIGASESQTLSGNADAACRLSGVCSDATYLTIVDAYQALGDGSTGSSTGTSVGLRNTTSASTNLVLASIYDVEGLRGGEYYLRLFISSGSAGYVYVFPYNADQTTVNSSANYIGSFYFDGTGGKWIEINVTNAASYSYVQNGRVKLRTMGSQSGALTISEAYLKQPPTISDFQLLPQGASQARLNVTITNEWKLITSSTSFSVTGASCTVVDVNNGTVINSTKINLITSIDSVTRLVVSWFTNSSAGIQEGNNYEVKCSAMFDSLLIENIEQYVYIEQYSVLQQIWNWILSILGFTSHTDSLVTNLAAQVQVLQIQGYPTQLFISSGQLIFNNTQLASYTNVSCNLNTWYPNATKWITNGLMTYSPYDEGVYLYNVTLPGEIGPYRAVMNCSGGALSNSTTARGSATWQVLSSGNLMTAIS